MHPFLPGDMARDLAAYILGFGLAAVLLVLIILFAIIKTLVQAGAGVLRATTITGLAIIILIGLFQLHWSIGLLGALGALVLYFRALGGDPFSDYRPGGRPQSLRKRD